MRAAAPDVGHSKASSQCVYSPNALLSFCHYHNNKKALPDSTADVCFLIELSLSLFPYDSVRLFCGHIKYSRKSNTEA